MRFSHFRGYTYDEIESWAYINPPSFCNQPHCAYRFPLQQVRLATHVFHHFSSERRFQSQQLYTPTMRPLSVATALAALSTLTFAVPSADFKLETPESSLTKRESRVRHGLTCGIAGNMICGWAMIKKGTSTSLLFLNTKTYPISPLGRESPTSY